MNQDCNFDRVATSTELKSSACLTTCLKNNCTEAMLNNDSCDIECNNIACGMDWGKCITCGTCFTDPNACIYPECSNSNCKHFDDTCATAEEYLAFINQLKNKNFDYKTDPYQTCFDSLTSSCTRSMLNNSICDKECDTEACGYDLGKCIDSCNSSCESCFTKDDSDSCITCKTPGNYLYYSKCVSGCLSFHTEVTQTFRSLRGTENITAKLCVPKANDESNKDNPAPIYVTSNRADDKESSDGSKKLPYTHITLALAEVHNKYSTIYLLKYTQDGKVTESHYLDDYDNKIHKYTQDYAKDDESFGVFGVSPNRIEIKPYKCTDSNSDSTSCYNGTRPIILWNSISSLLISVTSGLELVITEVDLSGYNSISNKGCTNFEFCTYCPNFSLKNNKYYSDRDQEVDFDFASFMECEVYKSTHLFNVEGSGKLTLNNVKIYGWRAQFLSLINMYGSDSIPQVNLINVDFQNIMPYRKSSDSAIIRMYDSKCSSTYKCGKISYIGGKVSLLNNGYEAGNSINLRGFIYAIKLEELTLENVSFEYNLAYKGDKYTDSILDNGLIYIKNFKKITVKSCTFKYNYVSAGIFSLSMENTYVLPSKSNKSGDSNMYHITFESNTFQNNYGPLILLRSVEEHPNINFSSNTFMNNTVNSNDYYMIDLTNSKDAMTWYYTSIFTILVEETPIKTEDVLVYPRNVTFTDTSITNCYVSLGLIQLKRFANVVFSTLNIAESLEHSSENYNYFKYLVHDYFKAYSSSYIITSSDTTSISTLHKGNLFYLEEIVGLNLNSLKITKNFSSKGCTNIYIQDLKHTFTVISASITGNICDCVKGIGITALDVNAIMTITGIEASDNVNKLMGGYGVLMISGVVEASLQLINSSFLSIESTFGNGAYLKVDAIVMKNLKFHDNMPKKFGGAALWIDTPGNLKTISVSISDSTFKSNANLKAGGGAAFYLTNSNNKPFANNLTMTNCEFESNQSSTHAAAIFITSLVRLSDSSTITNCKFLKNKSEENGNLRCEYSKGKLTFNSCNFIENESKDGIALYISNSGNHIEFNNVNFLSNISDKDGSAVILQTDSNTKSKLITKNCKFEGNAGTAVKLEYDEWTDTNSIFTNNNVYQAAVLYAMTNSEASLNNSIITSNSAKTDGGVITLAGASTLNLNNCIVSGNSSKKSGGVIFMEQKSIANIQNSTLYNNFAVKRGAVISSVGCDGDFSYIKNSTISQNIANEGGTIMLMSSNMNISDSYIHSNNNAKSSTTITGIKASLSNLKIYNTIFEYQDGKEGGSLHLTTETYVEIDKCTFKNGKAETQGGAIYSLSSIMKISNSQFENLTASFAAGILAYCGSDLNITNSSFKNCKTNKQEAASIIKSSESKIEITHSFFEDFYSTGIEGIQLQKMHINNTKFRDGEGYRGGAIHCEKCKDVVLYSNTFFNNTASKGGGVYFTTNKDSLLETPYTISNCNFTLNSAGIYGGGLYSENLNLNISESYFINNTAEEDGAGINIQCPDLEEKKCSFYVFNNNFKNNTAKKNGGAISWLNFKPKDENNTYHDNQAEYGSNIASFASALAYFDEKLNLVTPWKSRRLEDENIPMLGTVDGLAPGQNTSKSLKIALVDESGLIVTTDSSTNAVLSTDDDGSIYDKIKVIADKGVFTFDSFTIDFQPGSPIKIKVKADGITKVSNNSNLSTYPEIEITFSLRECEIGESQTPKQCVPCEYGKYSIDTSDEVCKTCPDEAICKGTYKMVPKSGYWRKDMYTDTFYACPNPDACIGSPEPDLIFSGDCAIGYQGNLCQSCQEGYSRTSKNQCGGCPDATSNVFKLIGILICGILVCIVMVKTTIDSAYKQKSLYSIYIKIFFNYLQLVMLAGSFNLDWPQYVLELFSVQENAGSVTDQIFSVDCFISNKDGSGYSSEDVYYFKLIIMFALPALILLVSLLVWSGISIYNKTLKYFKSEFLATIVILQFLVHPNILKAMFSAFICMKIEEEEWLYENLDIKCWDFTHSQFAITIALPGIILWGLGIPTVCLFYLFKSRRKLNDISIRAKFGFLFNGYQQNRFYWEFVILYRKIIIIVISVFFSSISVPVQALSVMIVLIISLHLQNVCNPYSHDSLNQMEVRSILVATITIYCGLYYLTGGLSEIAKIAFFILIVSSNAYFLYYWLIKLLEVTFMKIPCVRRLFGKAMADGFDEDIFVVLPQRKQVIRKEGGSLFTFRSEFMNTEDIGEIQDLYDIYYFETKDLYMNIARFKNKTQSKSKHESNHLDVTNLEEVQEESSSEDKDQSI